MKRTAWIVMTVLSTTLALNGCIITPWAGGRHYGEYNRVYSTTNVYREGRGYNDRYRGRGYYGYDNNMPNYHRD